MSTTTSKPYDWLRQIPRSLLELDDVPLFGETPSFPWSELAETLSVDLKLDRLAIEATDCQWTEKDQLFTLLGENLAPLNIGISGLKGSLCWVMPKDDLDFLISKYLHTSGEEVEGEIEEGFYRFLGYQVLTAIGRINWNKTIATHILNNKEMPAEDSFVIDVKASWEERTVAGRLILSPSFQKAWKERFADTKLDFAGIASKASKLETTVHLELGRTAFTPEEWRSVKAGDFLLLDSCSVDAKGNGHVTLSLKGYPFYSGTIENGQITIGQHPDHREEDATMEEEPREEENAELEDEFDDFEDENFDEEPDVEGDDSQDSEAESSENSGEFSEEASPVEAAAEKDVKQISDETPPLSVNDIPMSVVVEAGRLKMSLQKLVELQPGNVLDLSLKPEDGVDLTVNGKRVAKAELLRVGDTLGVRILDIG